MIAKTSGPVYYAQKVTAIAPLDCKSKINHSNIKFNKMVVRDVKITGQK